MAAKDKTTLASDITTNLANGGQATAAQLRTILGDVLDSMTQTAKATGAGTDYTLTGSTARVDFGTTDVEVALPGAGTFLLIATVQLQADAAGAGDEVLVKLRNSTDGADVGVERRVTLSSNSGFVAVDLMETVTVAAGKTVQLWAHNATSARGKVLSTRTELKSIRLG